MSQTRYLRKSKSRKGISPVIATVILVAVAVVIAAALAGFAGSLFGSYSNGAQIKLQSATLNAAGDIALQMSNSGNAADQVASISTTLGGAPVNFIPGAVTIIPANSQVGPYGPFLAAFPAANLVDGQQVTMQIHMQSGQVITQTVTVTP